VTYATLPLSHCISHGHYQEVRMKKYEVVALLARTMEQVQSQDPTLRALVELKRIISSGHLSPPIRRKEARKQNRKRPRLFLTPRRKTA
jgi:hypothetical protein